MALDSKLTQTINVRAKGDELLRPLKAMGNELNRLIEKMQQVANPSTAKGRAELAKLTKDANGALRTITQLNDLMNAGSRTGRARASLLGGLNDQAFGKQVLNASRLKTELDKTTKASEALEVRLAQLYKKFEQLGNAGRAVGKRDISKALNTQEAIKQVQQLEREIARLDGRNASRGGLTGDAATLRAQLGTSASTLLSRAQNGRRTDFSKEIGELSVLVDKYKQVTRGIEQTATAAQRAASQRRSAIMDTINMNEAQLRASVGRAAAGYKFTPDQARQTNLPLLNAQLEQGYQRLNQFQIAMSKAVGQGRSQAVIDRLAKSFENLKQRIAEAEAQKKAFDALPEQRMKTLTSSLFADGGLAFGARIAGASLLTAGIFGVMNAAKESAQYVAQLEDAFAKLQAISGSTDTEMAKFAGTLMTLSENSRYSTLEIAEGATQLAQAGYAASEAAGVLEASLNLAAGSGSTVAEAIDTMTSSLGGFQLQASEAGHVADVLMQGLNQSKLSITQMQAALQYAGATAHETGISLEELTAISASLANAGIKSGSTIGTGIRQLLVDLQTPTDKFKQELDSLGLTMADVDVKSKGLAAVVQKLTDAGFSAEAAYAGFEVRAAAAFLAFRNQIDLYDELSAQLTQSGAAAEAAAKANESLSAKWQQTKNKLGELVTMLSGPFISALKAILDIVGTVVSVFVNMLKGISDLVGGSRNLSIALTALLPIIGACFGPAGILIGGIAALLSLGTAATSAAGKMDELTAATNEAEQKFNSSRQTVTSVDEAIDRLIQRQAELKDNHVALQVETLNLTEKFEGLSSILGGAAQSYDDLVSAMLRYRGVAMRDLEESARSEILAAQAEGTGHVGQFRAGAHNYVQIAEGAAQSYSKSGLNPINKANGKNLYGSEFQAALTFMKGAENAPWNTMTSDQLIDQRIKLKKIINDLTIVDGNTNMLKTYLDKLKEQLGVLQQIEEARAKITTGEKQVRIARTANSPQETKRYETFTNVQSQVQSGLESNKNKPGTGDAVLRGAMATAKKEVAAIEAQLNGMDRNSAEAKVLLDDLGRLKGEIAKVQRASDEATRELLKGEKAGPGEDLQGSAVASLIKAQFNGANVYSYGKRSYKEQQRLYNRYKAGQGPLAAKPGRSLHGSGHAIDMTPIPGLDIDQVGRFLESRGVELLEQLNEWDPVKKKYHWHFAWKPKKSNFQKQADNDLLSLLEQRASYQTGGASKRIAAIIGEAKAGVGTDHTPESFRQANAVWQAQTLHEFDVKNPIEALDNDPVRLKARAEARAQKIEETQEAIRKNWADYYKAIGEKAVNDADLAFQENERIFNEAMRQAEKISEDAQRRIDVANNRTNRNNYGAGDEYILGRNKEAADQKADLAKIQAMRNKIYADSLAASKEEADARAMPEGEARDAALADVAKRWADIGAAVDNAAKAQANYNAQFEQANFGSMRDRLEGAAQAWMEQNGAMDSFAKRAQNFVGPALDNLKGGLTDMFASLMDGSKSWKQALGDMLKSFAKFVISYVAECLAMLAITELMKALGVPVPPAMQFGGGKFGGGVTGPASDYGSNPSTGATGMFTGGITGLYGGGEVSRGVSNRDSALYNLAHGEYVVRNKSVREIGLDGMDMINKHGAKGLARLKGANVMQNISMPKQETNVYVVKPESQPAMGPNDVLVTVHEDILQGGATKKLIKQVAQGA